MNTIHRLLVAAGQASDSLLYLFIFALYICGVLGLIASEWWKHRDADWNEPAEQYPSMLHVSSED